MNCQADRLPIFAHAREVAAELAARIQPVHVPAVPPLPTVEPVVSQPTPLYLARPKRVGDAKKQDLPKRDGVPMPNLAKKNGRPVIQEQRASTIQRHRANGEPYWIAQVRGASNVRTHLGPHRTREHALAACERFMATGLKPAGAKRGMKVGQRQQPKQAQNRSTIGRKAHLAPKRPSGSQKAASGPDKPRTTWREIAKRFQ